MRNFFFLLFALVFAACQNESSTTNASMTTSQPAPEPVAATGPVTKCYLMAVGKDSTFVKLSTDNTGKVSGEMNWRPFEKDGGYGTLEGSEKDGKIMCVWSYTIEGSEQKEQVHFALEGETLVQYVYELDDKGGMLRPKDTSKPLRTEKFATMECR